MMEQVTAWQLNLRTQEFQNLVNQVVTLTAARVSTY